MATPGLVSSGPAPEHDSGFARSSRWWRLGALVAIAGHLVVLYVPTPPPVSPSTGIDKVVHVLAFALPTIVLAVIVRSVALPAVIFAAHAPISELVQGVALADRSADVLDVLADLTGVGLVVLSWLAAARVHRT